MLKLCLFSYCCFCQCSEGRRLRPGAGDSGPRAETPAKTPAKTPGGCPGATGSCPGVCPGVWDPETPPPGWRLRFCKLGDSGISHFQRLFFVGDLYKAPFFPIWLLQLSLLSPPLLTLKSLPFLPIPPIILAYS